MTRAMSLLALLLLLGGVAYPAFGSEGSAVLEVRRMLDLLLAARAAYLEAFEGGGTELESPLDLEEARLLVSELRLLNERQRVLPAELVDGLQRDLAQVAGRPDLPERLLACAEMLSRQTGLALTERPEVRPSAQRGAGLYAENCAGCHGARGAGDGPDAVRAGLAPPDFTSEVFMRRETPRDFFLRIGVGHRRRGMPEWAEVLSVRQRWDLVAHLWGLRGTAADRAGGARLWRERCAACHGTGGEGASSKAPDLSRNGALDERSDRALFVMLFRGPHAGLAQILGDDDRWRVIAHLRTLSLGGVAPGRARDSPAEAGRGK